MCYSALIPLLKNKRAPLHGCFSWLTLAALALCAVSFALNAQAASLNKLSKQGKTELTVSAAASLTLPFKELARAFEAQHPEYQVILNMGASGALLHQISRGAPVDLFASADLVTMDLAEQQALLVNNSRINFTRNALVLIAPNGSSARKTSSIEHLLEAQHLQNTTKQALASLQRVEVGYLAMGNPKTTPNARYAKNLLQKYDMWEALTPKLVLANNVRHALQYVVQAEVEAGFVFASDAFQAGDAVQLIYTFDTPDVPEILYPMAVIRDSPHQEAARAFIRFVLSEQGQSTLLAYGFLPVISQPISEEEAIQEEGSP